LCQTFFPYRHEERKVDAVLMRRRIGTMVETELAIVALIDDAMMVRRGQFGDVALVPIDPIQERVERRTEIEATPTTIADVIDAKGFFVEYRRIDWLKQA
jgi:hypothetical protein